MNSDIYEQLITMVSKEYILEEEPMRNHTTFRVGGEAELFIKIKRTEELAKVLPFLRQIEKKYFILGNGSNLLVSDKGYEGAIIQIAENMSAITCTENKLIVQAGALLSKIANTAADMGLSGMEFASGIPGTIGGAVVMNAGAYDGEMKDIVESVTVLNETGEILVLKKEDMEFGYRKSAIKNRPFIVTEVALKLIPSESGQIREKMRGFSQKRKAKQPLEFPSAGSTFKRPEGYFAGKLIMDAGLRGFSIGGAQVSEKHCGFVVNRGNAVASDIYELIQEIQTRVYNQFGVSLEPEVIFLGEF